MKVSKKSKIRVASRSARQSVKSATRVKVAVKAKLKEFLDIIVNFGEGNISNFPIVATKALYRNTADCRRNLKTILRQRHRNIKTAIVVFPDSEKAVLTFGKQSVRSINA